jgi:Flp pilus assembly protein TadG
VTLPKIGARRRLTDNRSGAVATNVAIAIPLLLTAAAAAFDMGSAYVTRTVLQNTADSAALAGASALPDTNLAQARALVAADANMPASRHGNVLVTSDILTGNWNSTTRVFSPGGTPLNAVEIVTRRSQANGNALPAIFAMMIGKTSFDVVARAVATTGGGAVDNCLRNGFLADGNFEVGSKVAISGDTCVHGQTGMKFGSDVQILSPAEVTYGTGASLQGLSNSGNVINTPVQQDQTIIANGQIDSLLTAIQSNAASAPKPNWSWTVDSNPSQDFNNCNPVKWTLYIRKKVDLSSCSGLMRDFAVFGQEIKLPSGSSSNPFQIKNMFFASNTWIETGSNLDIGASDYCTSGADSVFFLARNHIKFGSDIRMWGVQVISGASGPASIGIEFGDDYQTTAVSALSDGFLKLGSSPNVAGSSSHVACNRDDPVLETSGLGAIFV